MSSQLISGVQQIGVGIPDVHAAKYWYRDHFGMRTKVFADEAEAALMIRYTSGVVQKRNAVLALNMNGGGGMEIWQYTSKVPVKPHSKPLFGDLGIYAAKIKSRSIAKSHNFFKSEIAGSLHPYHGGGNHFWVTDPWENVFDIVPGHDWFSGKDLPTGGVYGAVIGVSDIEASLKLYRDVFGINELISDVSDVFTDIPDPEVADERYRRVVIRKTVKAAGAFSKLLGGIEIELVQALDRKPKKIFENRDWGDAGFIHLCFDTLNMEALQKKCESSGFAFTVNSGTTFDMGDSGGHFTYLEDPDGTLIEMVETHKVPILKKLGLFLNIKKRGSHKTLPDWMVRLLGLSKV